ncbi:TetR/AcrR family transcriptional regulator [Gordonia insulae]|uniref:Tetracycline repressor protein class B from transposon Tn10 n=1 Tax=Gordonia insulae TaxID=2420509 RepID=A0A3G8JS55_9ACTN|nr:TetR/AcrR family transcriptional regulator [Gordonia insulae]AZG47379.1 Tetracycline repressor protein class B from transposon Tn10 [Gordonia insulae]
MGTLYATELFPLLSRRGSDGFVESGREGPLSPAEKPAEGARLTLAAIVDAAIEVADRDGIGALSMRRIADELGVGAMSLYRHVDDKDALLQEMSEEIGRRFPYPVDDPEPMSWRDRVRVIVDIDWELYRRHPWVVLAYSSPRHSFGDESLRCLDWFAAGFLELGVDLEEATGMALTVWSHVHGVALVAVSDDLLRAEKPSERPDGLEDLIEGRGKAFAPHLSQLAGSARATRLVDPRARLDDGIGYLCAGFAASLDQRRLTSRADTP